MHARALLTRTYGQGTSPLAHGDHEVEFPLGTYRMHSLAECNLATEPILVA